MWNGQQLPLYDNVDYEIMTVLSGKLMEKIRFILISLLLTIVLWGAVSWPLPKHTFSGIPASAENIEKDNVRTMIPGDHLQFLYHLWLGKDTFFGPTKLFSNPYEFNTGSDDDRRDTSMRYYLPFSLIFSITSGNNYAFGWNATGFVSLWLTFLFTWLLARRYTTDEPCAILAASISIIFPYRWITLLGGSPTGLAMMWVPIACYGLDVMVRDKRAWGGALAGVAIFLSGWADPHVTFFTTLLSPFWCIICYLSNRDNILPNKTEIKKILIAVIPFVVFAVFIMFQAKGTKTGLEDTRISNLQERIHEISLFSPHLYGILRKETAGMDRHVYIGLIMSILLACGMTAVIFRSARRQVHLTRILLPATLLLLAVLAISILSSGINNPGGALYWLRLCKILPPYGMIRQPAKIYIILPVILAVFSAITLPHVFSLKFLKGKTFVIYSVILLALVVDYGSRIDPTICRLDKQQDAYKAIVDDSAKENKTPRILCLPLWPGDSHWTSLNQYYVSLYRLRMMNGYRPTRRQKYFDEIYMGFENFNAGSYGEKQIDDLLKMGVGYIVLHENAFPEKVSPFSVSHTIYELLRHPRIKLLKQDGAVWSFKIVDAPDGIYEKLPDWSQHFPSRLWQAENSENKNGQIMEDSNTSGGKYLCLDQLSGSVMINPYSAPKIKGLCYMARTKGSGSYLANVNINGQNLPLTIKTSNSDEWAWQKIMIPALANSQQVALKITAGETPLDIDLAILATDDWNPTEFTAMEIPAPIFFHAGYTDLTSGEVILSPDREPAEIIFYGPKLPMPAGNYKITVQYSSDAEDGTMLGQLRSRYSDDITQPSDIIAGQPVELICKHPANLRLALDLKYSRNAVLRIKSVIIKKTESE